MKMRALPILLGAVMVASQVSAQMLQNTRPSTTARQIDNKARDLTAPDRDKVKALTNAVMADDGITGQIADTMSPLTDAVAETEYQFHAGHAKPVTED